MARPRKTQQRFINDAMSVHGTKYNYNSVSYNRKLIEDLL